MKIKQFLKGTNRNREYEIAVTFDGKVLERHEYWDSDLRIHEWSNWAIMDIELDNPST